jgi:hypothetical protein
MLAIHTDMWVMNINKLNYSYFINYSIYINNHVNENRNNNKCLS